MLHSIQIANSTFLWIRERDCNHIICDVRLVLVCCCEEGGVMRVRLHPGGARRRPGPSSYPGRPTFDPRAALAQSGRLCAPHLSRAFASIGRAEFSNFKCSLLYGWFLVFFLIRNWKKISVNWNLVTVSLNVKAKEIFSTSWNSSKVNWRVYVFLKK